MSRKLLFLWGFLLILAGSTSGALFTGEYFDDSTQLQYNRARWYAPAVGRFVSQDSYYGKLGKPISNNKFVYANSDSINIKDPSGQFGLTEIGVANNIASVLNNIEINFSVDLISAALDPDSVSATSMGWSAVASMAPFAILKLARKAKIFSRFIGSGKVAYSTVKKLPSAEEIAAAEKAAEALGLSIYLRPYGAAGADAFVSGVKFDIKTITGGRGVSTNIKKSMKSGQANRFIIDGRPAGLTKAHFEREMGSLVSNGYIPEEVIVILGDGAVIRWIL